MHGREEEEERKKYGDLDCVSCRRMLNTEGAEGQSSAVIGLG